GGRRAWAAHHHGSVARATPRRAHRVLPAALRSDVQPVRPRVRGARTHGGRRLGDLRTRSLRLAAHARARRRRGRPRRYHHSLGCLRGARAAAAGHATASADAVLLRDDVATLEARRATDPGGPPRNVPQLLRAALAA